MRILLDESLPRRLKRDMQGHSVKTVPEVGWQGKKNGELLRLMAGHFDVFVTADQNLHYQINLRHAVIPIIILVSATNRYDDLKPLIKKLLSVLNQKSIDRVTCISLNP